ncbi:MAG: class I SAM-dependent methyltransferase, partial [Candidatus Eremiobacteraeota bacterium]|nr:class I SAM-dependent methyltransferase [Candidatus Eremiobacteraeota bacterium]
DYLSQRLPAWERLIRPRAARNILEVGSLEGRSACWFLEAFPQAHLTCVDPFESGASEARFDHNTRLAGAGNRLTKLRQTSEVALPQLVRSSYDLIYIDGSHQTADVLFDAVMSERLLLPGGIMIFDDYQANHRPDRLPGLAVDLLTELRPELEVLHRDYQLILRKPG